MGSLLGFSYPFVNAFICLWSLRLHVLAGPQPSAEELEKQEEEIRQKQKEAREKLVAAKLEKEQTVRQRQDIMLKAWQADVMVEDDEPIPAPKERPRDQWDFDDEETDPNKPYPSAKYFTNW